jgi:predicted CXXCH cytochrome family protein
VDEGDGTVAHPGRLGASLGSDVCGRCHGQRIGRDIAGVLAHGDRFLPGTPLSTVSRPIFRDSRLADDAPGTLPFAARFWADGTPRLSAYEYQGLLLTPCHQDGAGLGCGDCHTMHGDEPDLQLVASWDGSSVCARCHDAAVLSGADHRGGHGGHGDAVACTGCHMPRTTYGLVGGMISHRITSPDPAALLGRHDQPDACTQCHVDRSRAWAVVSLAGLGLPEHEPKKGEEERERWASRVALDLVGGDPIQRSLAAHALARPEAVGDASDRAAALALALHDDYPAVRLFAARGLSVLATRTEDAALAEAVAAFDFLAEPDARETAARAIRDRVGVHSLARDPGRLEALEQAREASAIWIGE